MIFLQALAAVCLLLLATTAPRQSSAQSFDARTSVGQPCERGDGLGGVCMLVTACLQGGGAMEGAGRVKLCPSSSFGSPVVCCRTSVRNIAKRKCAEWETGGASGLHASDTTVAHIIGGEEVNVGEFPHMVSLLRTVAGGQQHFCGGSLIAADFVLTAAHCVNNMGSSFEVRVGAHDLGNPLAEGTVKLNVLQVIVPEGYQDPGRYHDIALLRLSSKASISHRIRPVCLPFERNKLLEGTTLTVAGWGLQDGGVPSQKLLKTNLDYDDQVTCNRVYSDRRYSAYRIHQIYPSGISNTLICASKPGADACKGDSGGPLMTRTPGRHVPTLVGIVSQGLGCSNSVPGTYTRVESYLDWIVNIVWRDQE